MQHQRNVLLYIIGHDAPAETYDYLYHLLPEIRHLSYRIVIVNQTTTFLPELHAIAAQHNDIEIISLDMPTNASQLLHVRTMIAYLRELQPTIVHLLANTLTSDRDSQIAMWLANVSCRILSVATTTPNTLANKSSFFAKFINQRIIQTIHTIIVPTTTIKQDIQSNYQLSSTRIAVIPIGINTAYYALHQINRRTRADYQLPAQGSIIAAIGSFIPNKGHPFLINAMRSVWQQYPDTHLVLVGSGPEISNLHALARKSSQPDHIHFLSPLEDERHFLALVDLYVHPSIQEGMSFHLLNAMALERPVIASAIPNVQEVIEANASGLLVRPNDADALASTIMRVFNDHELRITMGMNARTRISQRFQEAQWHKQTVDCYRPPSKPAYRV
jgi:glycosyltransferase involved in cell wall biosynthesis